MNDFDSTSPAKDRQLIVDDLHRAYDDAKHGALFPVFLIEAVENEIWRHPRKVGGNTIPAMPLAEFIHRSYPEGLETSVEMIERIIAGNEKAMLAWDVAWSGEPESALDEMRDAWNRAGQQDREAMAVWIGQQR